MARYPQAEETIIIDGLHDFDDDDEGADYSSGEELGRFIDLGRAQPKPTAAERQQARSACASRTGKFEYLAIDVCASVHGKGPKAPLLTTKAAADFVRSFIAPKIRLQEHFGMLLLDADLAAIGFAVLNRGTLMSSSVDVGLSFKPALLLPTHAVVMVHNHPTDRVDPSNEDRILTGRFVMVANLLGIRLLDHIIVGPTRHFSFRDAGALRGGGDGGGSRRRGRRR